MIIIYAVLTALNKKEPTYTYTTNPATNQQVYTDKQESQIHDKLVLSNGSALANKMPRSYSDFKTKLDNYVASVISPYAKRATIVDGKLTTGSDQYISFVVETTNPYSRFTVRVLPNEAESNVIMEVQ